MKLLVEQARGRWRGAGERS